MYPYITIFNKNISTYGILMVFGIALVFLLALKRIKKHNILIDDMFIISAFVLLFGLMGSSMLSALVTYPIHVIIKALFSGRFKIFGGLVFYGGLIGGIIGGIIGVKVAKVKMQAIEAAIVPFLPIGHAIGRIGCLMAGCCNGMEYDGPFAVCYTNAVSGAVSGQKYFPVQILEALLNIVIAIFLIIYSKKERPKFNILFLYLSIYAITRFTLEFLRGDKIRGIHFGFSTSQWISVALLIVSGIYFGVSYFKLLKLKST